MFASNEVLSLDEIYKAQKEIADIKLDLERQALFGEGRLALKEVEERERIHNHRYYQLAMSAPMIRIYDFIGRPDWQPAADLSEQQLTQAVDRFLILLANHGIEITISEPHENAGDPKLYHFITEVVFPKEIREIRLPGMNYSIDYNYYEPDHTHACIFITDTLLTGLFEPGFGRLNGCLAEHFFVNNDTSEELYNHIAEKFNAYHNYLDGCRLTDWSIETIELDESHRKCVIHLILRYGIDKLTKPLFTHRGSVVCYGKANNWWYIHRVDWPGLYLD
ncbi:hypothetical protein ACO2Q8_24615 [Larkinella sp. VNQ87]|uniref:hypothetical protein n=1 Tax=Larkinella sp. VNQ87 TaxID=3400921 RepID=UPI003C05DEF1